jgi:branched-chain amino acid transport system substrate-binding protein
MKHAMSILVFASLMSSTAFAADIKIGATAPLTGPQAIFGTTLFNGTDLYFEELNAAGGINGNTLVLSRQDDKADPKEGTLVAQKFCDDESIVAVIGHLNSGVQLAAQSIYSDCELPEAVLGSNPDITRQGAANIVRPTASDFAQGELSAQYALEKLGAKNAAIVNDKQAFGQGVSEIFADDFKKRGGEIHSTSSVNPTDVDFTAVITQLKSAKPDVVYMGAVMPQLALFAKQMREQGLNAKLLVPDGAFTPDFVAQAGKEAASNVVLTFPIPPADATPELVSFGERYKKRFGEEVGPYSIYGYVSGQIVAEAIKKAAEPTRADILPALKAVELDTMLGHVKFTDVGERTVAPMYLYEIQDGEFKMVGQAS